MMMQMYWKIEKERVRVKVFVSRHTTDTPEYVGQLDMAVWQFLDLAQMNVQPEFHEEVEQ